MRIKHDEGEGGCQKNFCVFFGLFSLRRFFNVNMFMIKFNEYYQIKEQVNLDNIQTALDIAGLEPTLGTGADIANTIISGLRAAFAKTNDERKKHIINAAISGVSVLPFGDLIKVLKLRKSKPVTNIAIKSVRGLRKVAKGKQAEGNRFNSKLN